MKKSINIQTFISKQIVDIKAKGLKELIKKIILFIRIFFKLPIYTIAFILCLIIRLLSPFLVIRISKVPSINFGNFARDLAIYYCKKKLKIDQLSKSHIDLFYIQPSDKIYNRQLAKMWKRKLNIVPEWILSPIHNLNNFLVKFFPNFNKHKIGYNTANDRDILNLLGKFKTHLAFTE